MKKYSVLIIFIFLSIIKINAQTNIIAHLNPEVFEDQLNKYTLRSPTGYSSTESHTNDGSGSLMFPDSVSTFLSNKITSKRFELSEGHHYLLRFYVKMVGPVHGQNILSKITSIQGGLAFAKEMQFNVSEINEWQEVIMPFYATHPGDYYFQIFTYKYLISTDGNYVFADSNLATPPTTYFDDFSVIETTNGHIISNEPYTPKPAFNSSFVRVDSLGNFSVQEDGAWKHIFPRLAYPGNTSYSFADNAKHYSEYGFNGIVNLKTVSDIKTAVENGCKYNSIQINFWSTTRADWVTNAFNALKNGEIPSSSLIMFTYDNEIYLLTRYITEKKPLSDWLDSNVVDPATGSRSIPVFELNGVHKYIGRADRNGDNNLMDLTGCYVTWSGEAKRQRFNPINTIELMDKADGLTAHSNIMQVQSYFHETFIPSLFKGIMQGAKGLQFWKDGTDYKHSKKDFRENVWAYGIKGADGAFARIDSMLEDIIVQPLGTEWDATITTQERDEYQRPTVAIGTRSKLSEDRNFLILANFADAAQDVKVSLTGITGAAVKDYFTGVELANITNSEFTVTIDKDNNGYLVLEIVNTSGPVGNGTIENPYEIGTLEDLKWIDADTSRWSFHYKQVADINLSESSIRIGDENTAFTGSYNGNGHVIDSLKIDMLNSPNGFFGLIDGATIKNLGLTNVSVVGGYYTGALIGHSSSGTIINCYTTGSVSSESRYIGGLVGYCEDTTTISNCYSECTVNATNTGTTKRVLAGGLVGEIDGNCTIEKSYATGDVTVSISTEIYTSVGGLVGYNKGRIKECYSRGDVVGNIRTGGFVGSTYYGDSHISDCYSFGDVIRHSGASGKIGGFAGYFGGGGKLENCYSIGSVYYDRAAPPSDKGFIGLVSGTSGPTDCFFDKEVSNQVTDVAATGKTTVEMQTQTTFTDAGWDFTNIWEIIAPASGSSTLAKVNADGNYPRLKEQPDELLPVELNALNVSLKYSLEQNYPNPFNPTTNIRFSLPEAAKVKLVVYNLIGEKVAELVNGKMEAGKHSVVFNASELTSGVYIYKIVTPNFRKSMKMLLIK